MNYPSDISRLDFEKSVRYLNKPVSEPIRENRFVMICSMPSFAYKQQAISGVPCPRIFQSGMRSIVIFKRGLRCVKMVKAS